MKYVDVIGIGAINYDYMFHCKQVDTNNNNLDDGRETICLIWRCILYREDLSSFAPTV